MELYRIAICEDSAPERAQLAALCGEILEKRGIAHTVCPFADAETLDETLEKDAEAFDLLLLDIRMGGTDRLDGMALAKKLYARAVRARVLFVTGYGEYALEAYGVHPVHFLMKPVEREALEEALCGDWAAHSRQKRILLQTGARLLSLRAEQLRYAESRNHAVLVCAEQENYRLAVSLSELEKKLPPPLFARCHNSFVVNLGWVAEASRTFVCLRDGTKLPVGRRYYKAFESALRRYVQQEL